MTELLSSVKLSMLPRSHSNRSVAPPPSLSLSPHPSPSSVVQILLRLSMTREEVIANFSSEE
jgi:hypothetical protein